MNDVTTRYRPLWSRQDHGRGTGGLGCTTRWPQTARRQAGGISTGAAIHNLGEEALVVGCQLMKDGAVLEEEEISLEANGQEARYIEEMFTSTDTSDFVGLVRCTAPEGEGMFTGCEPWNSMPATASSPRYRWCRFQRGCLRNR